MSESLSDAVREAAMVEADRKVAAVREECGWASDDAAWYRHGFAQGAVWVAGRLPGRDEIAAALWNLPSNVITLDRLNELAKTGGGDYVEARKYLYEQADAVLELIRECTTHADL